MGEDELKTLVQESLAVATRTDAMKPSDLARVVIDTTVQPKAVMFPPTPSCSTGRASDVQQCR
jgi:IS5 family transposase